MELYRYQFAFFVHANGWYWMCFDWSFGLALARIDVIISVDSLLKMTVLYTLNVLFADSRSDARSLGSTAAGFAGTWAAGSLFGRCDGEVGFASLFAAFPLCVFVPTAPKPDEFCRRNGESTHHQRDLDWPCPLIAENRRERRPC